MDLKEFLLAISTDWVALMSGIASVILAIVGVAKKREQVPRWVFAATAMACFFLASIRICTTEHRARLASEKQFEQSTTPKLVGAIEYVAFLPRKQGDVAVAVFASINNEAAPSFADVGPVKIILPDGKNIESIAIGVPANGILIAPNRPGELSAFFPSRDYLRKRQSKAALTNGI